jgi:4-hydroxybenzoate polyprenyltransferase
MNPATGPAARLLDRLRHYGSLVVVSHTVFAMPFAAAAVVLSLAEPHVPLTTTRAAAMLICLIAARTSAMAFNRYADRELDAKNPRTRNRPIPAGLVRPREALALAAVAGLLFLLAAAALGTWPRILAPFVWVILLGYSYAKRFTWAAHVWLGVALALAPGGAWIAMGAAPCWGIALLMAGVATWLLGFDVLYALQDEAFDRASGLRSIPARFGARRALDIAASSHVVTVAAFGATGSLLGRGPIFFAGVVAAAALLAYEHALVRKHGLGRLDKAFFDMNAYVGVAFFACTVTDALAGRG